MVLRLQIDLKIAESVFCDYIISDLLLLSKALWDTTETVAFSSIDIISELQVFFKDGLIRRCSCETLLGKKVPMTFLIKRKQCLTAQSSRAEQLVEKVNSALSTFITFAILFQLILYKVLFAHFNPKCDWTQPSRLTFRQQL